MTITYHAGRRIQGLSTDLTESIRQGYDGGNGYNSEPYLGGGGGGAGEVGESISSGTTCATGGDGLQSDIWQGNSIYYAGGGGATSVRNSTTGGAGGQGGGGAGGSASNGVAGTDYLGGGGGATWDVGYGGAGGKGVVILQFTTSGTSFSTTGSPSSDTSVSGKTTLKYTSTGTFVISSGTPDVRYLVIGGGGGGCSGGGGAGGFRTGTLSLSSSTGSSGTHTVTVGTGSSGGNGGSNTPATNGLDSVFDTITSIGGGGGGGAGSGSGLTGGTGGSGGGAGKDGTVGSGTVTVNDLKPANVQAGSRMEETDTRKMYNLQGASTATYSDFTGTWTSDSGNQVQASNGVVSVNMGGSNRNDYISFDLGSTLSDSWTLRFKQKATTNSFTLNSGNAGAMYVSLSSGTNLSGEHNDGGSVDSINTRVRHQSTQWKMETFDVRSRVSGTTTSSGDAGQVLSTGAQTYYVEVIKDGETTSVKYFDDSAFTSQVGTTKSVSSNSIGTNLQYLGVHIYSQSHSSGDFVAEVSEIKIYDGITSVLESSTWQEIGA